MLIGQVSKLTGVSDDRIRNYDKKGLIVVDTDNKKAIEYLMKNIFGK